MKEAQTDTYRTLKEHLTHHSPLCRMMVERRPAPAQVTTFIDKSGEVLGRVSGLTIESWKSSPNNNFVEIMTNEGCFEVPTIPHECKLTSFEELTDLLIGNRVLVTEGNDRIKDFDVEYCGPNGFECSYIEYGMRQFDKVSPKDFKEAHLYENTIQVYKQEYDIITIPIELLH